MSEQHPTAIAPARASRLLTATEFHRLADVPPEEWLGHSNIATTRIYDHRRTRPEDSPTFKVSY